MTALRPPPPPSLPELSTSEANPLSPSLPTISLQPSNKKDLSKSKKIFRRFRSVFRSFPIIAPTWKIPVSLHGSQPHDGHVHGGTRMTGTLFGHLRARINLGIQEISRCLPLLILELGIPTGKLLQNMRSGLVQIALEFLKKPAEKVKIVDEAIWTVYCNGRKSGYGVKREATEEDLCFMQTLHAVATGAGVVPMDGAGDQVGADGMLT